jgi:prolyl-tRNA synthetase
MRMTRLFLRTLRDDPADADVDSYRLLVRAGFIRKVASGVYSWLPLGERVLRRVSQIVREEMDAAGAQEVTLPIIQPLELWQRSGRDADYGPLMFRLEDRKETGFCLSPTAEELITSLVAGEYTSYRDLPVNLYQVNWKYRDELRPRFGLLRGREFLMKDAYSFDVDGEALTVSYQQMYDAYQKVFERCGLVFRAVLGEAGEIGGDINHEFMAVADVGEDDFVWCPGCDYAANVEVARMREPAAALHDGPPMEAELTPGLPGIAGVAEHMGVTHGEMLKCIAFDLSDANGRSELGLALVPGDREVNEFALKRAFPGRALRLYTDDDFAAHRELPKGYIGPHHPDAVHRVADGLVHAGAEWVTGANRVDHHVRHAVEDRDFTVTADAPIALVRPGDPCPQCGGPLAIDRGIEVGQVFQLGTKYSVALGALYTDTEGQQHPMVMGCYGIGISRTIAAIVEQHHDDAGIAWPAAVAPFAVELVALAGKGAAAADVVAAADRLYDDLRAAGIDVLYDDREASPGVKFADADLLGVPVQIVVGAKGLGRGVVERKIRATGERDELALADAASQLVASASRA